MANKCIKYHFFYVWTCTYNYINEINPYFQDMVKFKLDVYKIFLKAKMSMFFITDTITDFAIIYLKIS